MNSYLSCPSFDPEYAFQIRKTDGSGFEISAIIFKENLWYSEDKDLIEFFTYKRSIDKDLAIKIDTIFRLFMDSIPNRKYYGPGGEDGTTYQFKRHENGNIQCGETWSPNKESILGELIAICDIIMNYAKREDAGIEKIIEQIETLHKKIK